MFNFTKKLSLISMKKLHFKTTKRGGDPEERESLGQRLRTKRKILGFRQEDMAARLHISTTAYSKIERGESGVNMDRLHQICNVLHIDITKLIKKTEAVTIDDLYNGLQILSTDVAKISEWIVSEKPQIYRVADTGTVVSKQEFTMTPKPQQQEQPRRETRGRKRKNGGV